MKPSPEVKEWIAALKSGDLVIVNGDGLAIRKVSRVTASQILIERKNLGGQDVEDRYVSGTQHPHGVPEDVDVEWWSINGHQGETFWEALEKARGVA